MFQRAIETVSDLFDISDAAQSDGLQYRPDRTATLRFDRGLTVLTGETGAGKSILDALGLALGSRADFRLIREGEDTAQVSAVFTRPPTTQPGAACRIRYSA